MSPRTSPTRPIPLMPHQSLHLRRIPLPHWLRPLHARPDLLDLVGAQHHAPTPPILLQPPHLGRPRNRNHTLARHPRQRHLCRGTPLPRGDLLHLLDNRLVPVEVLALELGHLPTEVVGREVVGRRVVERVHEPAVPQRAVRDVRDAQRLRGGDQAVGLVHGFEGGVLGLHGVDRGDGVCAPQRRGRALGQADVFRFAGAAEAVEGGDGLLERGVRVDAVQVVQVWCEAQTLDGALDVGVDMLGRVCHAAVDAARAAAGVEAVDAAF
jgi:hypothetical protein